MTTCMDESTAPIDEGDEYVVEIEDLGEEGDGIARIDGFVVFVPDGTLGERVSIRIVSVDDSFATASILEE